MLECKNNIYKRLTYNKEEFKVQMKMSPERPCLYREAAHKDIYGPNHEIFGIYLFLSHSEAAHSAAIHSNSRF